MKDSKFAKGIVSLALAGSFIRGTGAVSTTRAQDDRRDRRERREEQQERRAERWERAQEREELARIRQMDRQRRLRYQMHSGNRLVGYYDRNGVFHAVGYYDHSRQYWHYQD